MSFKQNEIQVFGLDANALLPEDNSGDQAVVVPETLCPLDEAALSRTMQHPRNYAF
jgi:hypothetical protein